MAALTVRATVFGVDLTVPLLELPCAAASYASASAAAQNGHSTQLAAVPAPSAEVAELQRRLAASGDADVASLMSSNPAQLDPLDARGISRWLQAKGRNMDLAEQQIHVHAHWRQAFMPAGHIPEVCHDVFAALRVHHQYLLSTMGNSEAASSHALTLQCNQQAAKSSVRSTAKSWLCICRIRY